MRSSLFFAALALAVIAIIAVVIAVVTPEDPTQAKGEFVAGPVGDFDNASVTHFEDQHFYLVRLNDGSFIAHYEVDAREQLFAVTREAWHINCHVQWHPKRYSELSPNRYLSVPGFEGGAFRSLCSGSSYDATGRFVSGPSPGDLDPLPVTERGGQVVVKLADRPCPEFDNFPRVCEPIQ